MKSVQSSIPRWNDVTAIFGGRFDPPHIGHRDAVGGLFLEPGIKQVFIVPSASPPHKRTWAAAQHRAEMAKLNFLPQKSDPEYSDAVHLDLREFERARRNPKQPSYTFDTLQELRSLHPSLAFVIGADQLKDLSTWYRFPEILKLCHWLVLERKPYQDETALRTLHQWSAGGLATPTSTSNTWQICNSAGFLRLVPTDAPPLSSTKIRESLSKQDSRHPVLETPAGLLPEVWAYLKKHQLYGI